MLTIAKILWTACLPSLLWFRKQSPLVVLPISRVSLLLSSISVLVVLCLVAQLCPTLCDPMNCSPPDSSVQGIRQARILEWLAMPFSRGSSPAGTEPRSPSLQADSLPSECCGSLSKLKQRHMCPLISCLPILVFYAKTQSLFSSSNHLMERK